VPSPSGAVWPLGPSGEGLLGRGGGGDGGVYLLQSSYHTCK